MTDTPTTTTTTKPAPQMTDTPTKSISPLDRANYCSVCTFFFVSKLITTGHSRPLERSDVPPMPKADNSDTVDQQFVTSMSTVLDRTPSVASYGSFVSPWIGVRIVLAARGFQFFIGGLCLILWAICYGIQPVFIKAILVEIQLKHLRLAEANSLLSTNTSPSASNNNNTTSSSSLSYEEQVAALQSLNPLTGLSPVQLWIVCICTGLVQIFILNHAFFREITFFFSSFFRAAQRILWQSLSISFSKFLLTKCLFFFGIFHSLP